MNGELLAAWLVAIGTLLLAVIAIFQDVVRAWILRPKLAVSASTQPPCSHANVTAIKNKTSLEPDHVSGVYMRVKVENRGNSTARGVEVFAERLAKEQQDGSYRNVTAFDPMNLVWSHIGSPIMEAIPPRMHKYCGLGRIFDPQKRHHFPLQQINGVSPEQTVFEFDLQVKPFTKSHVVPPGKYRLYLTVGAANAAPSPHFSPVRRRRWF